MPVVDNHNSQLEEYRTAVCAMFSQDFYPNSDKELRGKLTTDLNNIMGYDVHQRKMTYAEILKEMNLLQLLQFQKSLEKHLNITKH